MSVPTKKVIVYFWTFAIFLFFVVVIAGVRKGTLNNNNYNKAKEYIELGDYNEAFIILDGLNYKDSDTLREEAETGIIYLDACILLNQNQYKESIDKFMTVVDFKDSEALLQLAKYKLAIEYFNNKNYDAARILFIELNGYEDSAMYLEEIDKAQLIQLTETIYNRACSLLENEEFEKALEDFNLILDYEDSKEKAELCEENIRRLELSHVITGGILNSFGITKEGKVLATGDNTYNQRNIDSWENIISIDVYGEYTIGLTKAGTVNVAGNLSEKRREIISTWEHIIDVAAGDLYVVALKSDKSVVAVGHNADGQCDVENWENVIDIDAGWRFTVGLTQDGELLFTGIIGDLEKDYLETKENWKDVIKIAASGGDTKRNDRGSGHVVGLTSDGHVIAIGDNSKQQCNVEKWEHVIAIAAGDWYTVGLTEEGKVLITGENVSGSKYINDEKINTWENIQTIAAGYGQTLVVKSDGHVDAMGFDDYQKCSDVIAWTEEIMQQY